jgi:rubredoxin
MAFPMTCRACGERFVFDPQKQPHAERVCHDAAAKAVEREVRCPRCGARRVVRFSGRPGLPPA